MLNRTVMYAKQHTPNSMRVVMRRTMLEAHNTRLRLTVPVVSRCEYVNIYHCAVRKTASQWIKALFSDPIVYRHSGLLTYDPRFYNWSHPQVCPRDRVALSLFFSRERFDAIPKPEEHRAFFVLRDPRDMVVSSYFSTRKSHAPMGDIPKVRKELEERPFKDGMLYLIHHLAKKGTFKALRSWATAPDDGAVQLFRYEDLTGPGQREQVDRLMRHCGIVIPQPELTTLLSRYSFSEMNSRAGAGTVSHYRKGQPGDWRNHFDDDIQEAFAKATGDLIDLLGYAERRSGPRTSERV
ncbi:sulfotransferase domain-containing protein [Couchioplanes caeruleus]|uniref:Sulfotransferase domain-containing protein n=1 Tax=Couchioplanes caeruleus TaxID=56438 RepID=A0A3N1GF83_9ACTN|nr:sulfotransferase domain-containing protein [Couchioplanes caeruleus]ROP28865.1 sulfotransferase domain-containing protein [Couchioplanes caeruleus]